MKIIVAHEGKQHSFKTAEALYKKGCLYKYVTTIYDKPNSFTRVLKFFLVGKAKKKCSSRKSKILPDNYVLQRCELYGLLRMFISRIPLLNNYMLQYYNWLHDKFGRKVAKMAIENKVDAVIMYDTNANSCWKELKAKAPHIKRILDVTIGNRLYLSEVYKNDCALFPETASSLTTEQNSVFDEANRRRLLEELRSSDYFLAGSNFVKKSLEYSGVDSDKIFVVNYGVDLSQFSMGHDVKCGKPLKLLFTGNCSYRKGVHHLLSVISHYKCGEVELNIAGGYDEQSDLYKKYSKCENIHFLGFVTRDILHEIYQKSDVFVLPSLAEGFAMVSLEALSAGLPVVCTTNSGCNDIIKDGNNGFVIDVSNEKALTERIDWFLKHKDKLPEMRVNARQSVSNHSWEDYGDNLIEKIKKII